MPKCVIWNPMMGKLDNGQGWGKFKGVLQLGRGFEQGPMVDVKVPYEVLEIFMQGRNPDHLICFLAQVSFASSSKKVNGQTVNISIVEEVDFIQSLTVSDFDFQRELVLAHASGAYEAVDKSTGEVKSFSTAKPASVKAS